MVPAAAVDTLVYFTRFKSTGIPEQQAKVMAETFAEFSDFVQEKFVTKYDFLHELRALEMRMTIRLGSMLVIAMGVFTAIIKFL